MELATIVGQSLMLDEKVVLLSRESKTASSIPRKWESQKNDCVKGSRHVPWRDRGYDAIEDEGEDSEGVLRFGKSWSVPLLTVEESG